MLFIGQITIIILFSMVLVWLDFYYGANFIKDFSNNRQIEIMATLLALNMATTTFLLSQITNFEITYLKKGFFQETKNEIKKNNLLLFILLMLDFFIRLVEPDKVSDIICLQEYGCMTNIMLTQVFDVSILLMFFLVIYDIFRTVIRVNNSVPEFIEGLNAKKDK